MSEFRNKLKQLDDDELDDITTSVNRERARRSQPAPEAMSNTQYARWVDEEIRKTTAAKAKESTDGSEG
jgi:hypothetical protein